MTSITFIYSSPSIEAFKELVTKFIKVFNIPELTVDDMFYYGVFCDATTYANFKHWDEVPTRIETPSVLTSVCSTEYERLDYVNGLMKSIIRGEEEKPEWMEYIEMTETCADYEAAPSNFLYVIAKQPQYEDLADLLVDFLYSPNMMMKTCPRF